ncbi:MAG: DUF4097 domain-containing protein [Spirochaetales bacterium]|nr:DUF4097 domain-containing protein [Spirochaetales bacterium]
MKRTLFSLILLLLLSTALISCSVVGSRISHALGGEEDYIMNEELFNDGIENIKIDWKSGDVSLKTWDGDQIIVREKSVTSLNSRTRMKTKNEDGTLTVNFASKGVWMLPILFKKDLEVLIPASWDMKNINVNTASSPVSISDLSTLSLSVKSVSGGISLNNMGVVGDTTLKSASGDITAILKAGVMFRAETASGVVKAKVGGKVVAAETKSASGDVYLMVNDIGRISASSSSGTVELDVMGKAEYIDAHSVSGNVKLRLKEDTSGFLMKAKSTTGTVKCEFPSSVVGDQYTFGDGSTKISLKSTSGKVHAFGA